jgi:hypothetical protein
LPISSTDSISTQPPGWPGARLLHHAEQAVLAAGLPRSTTSWPSVLLALKLLLPAVSWMERTAGNWRSRASSSRPLPAV